MKKVLCLLAALVMVLTFTCAVAEEVPAEDAVMMNPNGYPLIKVIDIFSNTDEGIESGVTVQACFGSFEWEDESDVTTLGFDVQDVWAIGLADDCVIFMPDDVMNPVSNVMIDDLEAWYEQYKEMTGGEFYAEFEFNENGEFVYLAFVYFPFG